MITKPLTAQFAMGWYLRLKLAKPHRSTQGFTLIEALIAIVIVSITLVSITPPIFLATATRVQNRRAQQAQQIAQGEIDRVRLMVERQQVDALTYLPAKVAGDIRADGVPPAPSGSLTGKKLRSSSLTSCANPDDGTSQDILLVDVDANCQPDFIVQTFRGGEYRDSATLNTAPPDGFVMGVRVYSIVANGNVLSTKPANLRASAGLGHQTSRPLAVLYATIVRNNSSKSLDIYKCTMSPSASGCTP